MMAARCQARCAARRGTTCAARYGPAARGVRRHARRGVGRDAGRGVRRDVARGVGRHAGRGVGRDAGRIGAGERAIDEADAIECEGDGFQASERTSDSAAAAGSAALPKFVLTRRAHVRLVAEHGVAADDAFGAGQDDVPVGENLARIFGAVRTGRGEKCLRRRRARLEPGWRGSWPGRRDRRGGRNPARTGE
jgi:hypothetical protein